MFFSVVIVKFFDIYCLFILEDSKVYYLVILNVNNMDMFILIYVDEYYDIVVSEVINFFIIVI